MVDVGKILARATGNAVLAQSEMMTGIPFFQQAIAKQERDQVRHDQVEANRARLNAGIRTGLVSEADVTAAGSVEDMVKLENFDSIFDGLVSTQRTARTEAGKEEDERSDVVAMAVQAGVAADFGALSTDEIRVMTAARLQKQNAEGRALTRSTTIVDGFTKSIDDLAKRPAPLTDAEIEQVAAEAEGVRAALAENADIPPEMLAMFQRTAGGALDNLMSGQRRKQTSADVLNRLASNDFTGLAGLSDPTIREEVLSTATARDAIAPVEANMEVISTIRSSPEVMSVLPPEMVQAINAIPTEALDAMSLVQTDPALAARIRALDFDPHKQNLARAKVEQGQLAPRVEDTNATFRDAASNLPAGSILHTLFTNTDASRLLEVRQNEAGNFAVMDVNSSEHPISAGMTIANNADVDPNMRLDILEPLTRQTIGTVQVPEPVRQDALRLKAQIEGQMTMDEIQGRMDHRMDQSQLALQGYVGALTNPDGFPNLVAGIESGDVSRMSRAAITGMDAAADYSALGDEAEATMSAFPEGTNERRRAETDLERARDNAIRAGQRENYLGVMTDIATGLYSGDFPVSEGDDNFPNFVIQRVRSALAVGGPGTAFQAGTPVPGESEFLGAFAEDAKDLDPEEQLDIALLFIEKAFGHEGEDVQLVADNFTDVFYDTQQTVGEDPSFPLGLLQSVDLRIAARPLKLKGKVLKDPDALRALAALSILQQ